MEIRDRVKELRRVRAGDLIAHPRNWRRHPASQAAALRGVLSDIGYADALLARETPDGLMLIDGHLRAETTPDAIVPVLILDVSEAEADRILLTHDPLAAMAEADKDNLAALLESVRFEDDAVTLMLAELGREAKLPGFVKGGLTDPDDVPEAPEPITKTGDLWLLGEHRLLCGDSTSAEDVGRLMGDDRAVLFATDPPYLVDYQGGSHPTSKSNAGVKNKDKDWSDSYHEINIQNAAAFFDGFLQTARDVALIDKAAWYVWHASARQADLESAINRARAKVHQQIIWVKSRPVLTYSHFMWRHEPCFYGWVEGQQPVLRPPANAQTIWEVASGLEDSGKSIHPTQKPVEIFGRPIEYHTSPGDICYEPFSGSGTQIIAAERLSRRCYALEIEPRYVDVAVKRWELFTGQTARLETPVTMKAYQNA